MNANYTLRYAPARGGVARNSILFIHGLWNDGTIWDTWARDFATRGYQSWSISMDTEVTNPSIWDYAAMVHDALERIRSEHGVVPVLVGHSLGGLVAQVVVSERAVPALVLVASAVPAGISNFGWSWIGNFFRYAPRLLSHLWVRGINRNVQDYLTFREMLVRVRVVLPTPLRSVWTVADLDPFGIGRLRQCDPPRISNAITAIIFGTVKVDTIQCQNVLILAGRHDSVISLRAQQALTRRYTDCSTMIVHRFGHMVMRDNGANAVAEQVLQWLERLT